MKTVSVQSKSFGRNMVEGILSGDHIATAIAISKIENKSAQVPEIMQSIHPYIGKARIIGFTGPPGVGKSTLVDQFIYLACKNKLKVGVLAIDASSPFNVGALLGDRIRIRDYSDNDNVFIRSMGTRGHLGGLAEASREAVKVLDAFGCDLVIIETAGVGQIELDVVKEVDTVIVTTMPTIGDYVQTMKAGIMEIGDVFAVNKADLSGADQACSEIEKVLHISERNKGWTPLVIKTCATKGVGINELWDAVDSHYAYLEKEGEIAKRRENRIREEIKDMVWNKMKKDFISKWNEDKELTDIIDKLISKEVDFYNARDIIIDKLLNNSKKTK